MTIQQPQGPTPVLQQKFGCGQSLLIVFLVFGGLFAIGVASSPAPTQPEVLPPQRLQGVALYKGRATFRICSRTDLHRCTVRWGYSNNGLRGTLASRPIPLVRAVPVCETQPAFAEEHCGSTDALSFGDAATMETTATCMDGYGAIYRDGSRFRQIDPRDEREHLPAGTMRIDCAEGYLEGAFDDAV
jgi:hypothetical protein